MDCFLNNYFGARTEVLYSLYMALLSWVFLLLIRPWISVMMKKKGRQNRRKRSLKVKEGRNSSQKQMDQVSECYGTMLLSLKLSLKYTIISILMIELSYILYFCPFRIHSFESVTMFLIFLRIK